MYSEARMTLSSLLSRLPAICATALGGLAIALPIHAATLSPGDLIKGPTDAVYAYDANGKRLVFPTEKTYKTWYADFSTVKTITANELAAITLGGNVTYRPGVKMVKITTDPKVYAVSRGGVLRHVTTEAIATALYGADWNQKIDDVPDTYFTNYTIGSPIQNTSDYAPATETSNVPTILVDKTPTTPAPTPTPTPTPTTTSEAFILTSSKSEGQAGDILTLTATAAETQLTYIELYFDGTLIKTCPSTLSCAGETQIPTSGTKSAYTLEARFTRLDQSVVSRTMNLPITVAGNSSLVKVRIAQTQIMPGQQASAVVEADVSLAVNRIDVYVGGVNVKACTTGSRECSWGDIVQGETSSTIPVYGKVTDTLGRTYTSGIQYITLSTHDAPGVTVTPAKNTIYAGEMVDVTVSATDSNGIAWIEVLKDGQVLKRCESAQPCTATTGPWSPAGTTIQFSGRAADTTGVQTVNANAASVSVTNP